MFKLVFLVAAVALAQGAKPNIGFGSFEKHHPKNLPTIHNPKVINGRDAKLGEFPHQVSLHLAGPLLSQHFCGGSLLTPSTVLTAGHCVTEVNVGLLQHVEVLGGIISQKDKEHAQVSKILKTIVHPDYPGGVAANDVAIHILATPFTLNENLNVISLPEKSSTAEGESTLSGWGSTSRTQIPTMPDILQASDLPIVPFDECNTALEGQGTPFDDTMICTGPLTGGYGACSGDSGGPLIQNNTLIGVVSWGFIPCGQSGVPSVFTSVASHREFIESNMV